MATKFVSTDSNYLQITHIQRTGSLNIYSIDTIKGINYYLTTISSHRIAE